LTPVKTKKDRPAKKPKHPIVVESPVKKGCEDEEETLGP